MALTRVLPAILLSACVPGCTSESRTPGTVPSQQSIDLAQALDAKTLRVGRRGFWNQLIFANPRATITKLDEHNGVHLPALAEGYSVGWVEGTDFRSGTIEVDVRGKDVLLGSFVGIAFHRKDDATYEVIYLRPYNFRVADPVRSHQAVQYIKMPEHDGDRSRANFMTSGWESVANPVDAAPADWARLRVVVEGRVIRVFVGPASQPTLEVQKLGDLDGGQVGLWGASEGDFANLVLSTP